ncbi:hypothetical protein [Okeania sp. KiyG1]|nr:hypothetical protein [Okeania sp. KiyG1]
MTKKIIYALKTGIKAINYVRWPTDQKIGSQASPWLHHELPLYKGMKKRS